MNVFGSSSDEPYIQRADFSSGAQFGFVPGKTDTHELGSDNKGLIYFRSVGPAGITHPSPTKGYYYFGAIDPFGKKVAFRSLEIGRGVAPDQTEDSWGRTGLPMAVDPAGNFYFFDVNVSGKSFVLNRIANDWWDELSVARRVIGVVNDNRVRIREQAGTGAAVLGYAYENEVAIVTETSSKQATIEGTTAPWYKVSLADGRTGWVFGGFLNISK